MMPNTESTLTVRKILASRFNLHRHLIKERDIKVLMSYMTMGDLSNLDEEEMLAFIKTGRENGTFRPPSNE